MKNPIRILVLVFFAAGVTFAAGDDRAGTTSASFLKLGVGARAAALGHAAVGLALDGSAVYWNPATLALLDYYDVVLSHNLWIEKMQHSFIGVAVPGGSGTSGIGAVLFNSGPQTRTEAAPGGGYVKLDEFSNIEGALILSHAVRLFGKTGVGISGKVIYEGLAGESAFAFAGDVGLFSRIEFVDVGFVARNFGSKVKFDNEAFPLPRQIVGGAAVHLLENSLTLSASGGNVGEGKTQFAFGAEYRPLDFVAIRAGYRTGFQDITGGLRGLTGGVGLNYGGIRLDYAYNTFGDLGGTHHFSFGFRIGLGSSSEPAPPSITPVSPPMMSPLQQEMKEEVVEEPPAAPILPKGTITANSLNVRAQPSPQAQVLLSLKKGDVVYVLEEAGEWVRVEVAGGRSGWVAKRYVQISP